MKKIISNLIYNYQFLLILNSPFKPLKLRWYFGPITMGTPYFLPRKWNKQGKPILIKYFGWHFNTLGWKTKWDEYRFEYNPALSIVLFGKQVVITFTPNLPSVALDCYWEAWLYYYFRTDNKLSKEERLLQVMKMYNCKWRTTSNNEEVLNNYYNDILKEKYLKSVNNE